MQLFILLIISGLASCKSGIFDNVSVYIRGLDFEDTILIEFDDSLVPHLQHKPSEVITIKNQFIPKLDTNSITNLTKVQNLTLTKNGIRDIRRGAFQNLPNLKVLNLSGNAIEEIRIGIFNELPMEDLFLDNNKISRIGYKAFSHMTLKKLFLQNNKISRWSKDWFADSYISHLDLSFNLIEDLPPNSFRFMSKPVNDSMSLIFTGNQLKKINNDVFNGMERFQRIFLDSNLIDRLSSGTFNGVKYINVLNLNNNSLYELDSDVLKNTQVDIVMLEDNKLRCLSTDIFRMEELDIDGNPITCFCVKSWLAWRDIHSNPSIYHITNLEQECI
ncbi:SLIT and NTRK-like protein 6 [Tribolium madens]|uniref:SLIT and NTRK-like protein 6 n=1 Tax=Tribolium madens TaxID=41895 RepID=UPI001CF72C01|nr:SLIT and NTRK-like protein 6 [Tribolium madens]